MYADSWQSVVDSGLGDPLPGIVLNGGAPRVAKHCGLTGLTGGAGVSAVDDTAREHWATEWPWANCVVRVAEQVIGLDVDLLGHGDDTVAQQTLTLLTSAGFDPEHTPRVTCRDPDSLHGVYYLRLPAGVHSDSLTDLAGAEVIRHGWRVGPWPGNVHPETGSEYQVALGTTVLNGDGSDALGLLAPVAPTALVDLLRRRQRPAAANWRPMEGKTLTPAQQAAGRAHTEAVVASWRERWTAALDWPEGMRDADGRGWRGLDLAWGWTLARLVVAPWSGLAAAEAQELYLDVLGAALDRADSLGQAFGPKDLAKAATEPVLAPPWQEDWADPSPRELRWFPESGISPTVIEADSMDELASRYANALVAVNAGCPVPFLFRMEGNPHRLVYVSHDPVTGDVNVSPVTAAVLRSMLGAVGQPRRKGGVVPADVVAQVLVLALSEHRIPVLRGLVCSPILHPDGLGWADTDGWVDGLLVRLRRDVGYRSVPDRPDRPAVAEAAALIRDVLSEVKFAHPAGLAGLVGRGVHLVAQPYLRKGPIIAVTAGNRGNGKSTAVEIIDSCALHPSERVTIPAADLVEAELEKRIDTALVGVARGVVVGNVPTRVILDSSSLSEVVTASSHVDIRSYGRNDSTRRAANNKAWAVTANNYSCSRDLHSRTHYVGIDAGVPRAEDIQWTEKHLQDRLERDHEKLNYALRVLVQAALVRLREDEEYSARVDAVAGRLHRGDFTEWARLTCAVGELLGVTDFGADQEVPRAIADESAEEQPEIDVVIDGMTAAGALDVGSALTCGELLNSSAVLADMFGEPGDRAAVTRLGSWLGRHQDVWSGDRGRQVKSGGRRRWFVRDLGVL